ncbi:MAG: adenylate kinase, partial [Fimbriimonadaceae bacterium]|nr:adenylate kinase [Chitinophagales bacterium]
RTDDQDEETIKKRVLEYRTKTELVANYYANHDLVREISGIGSINEIFDALKNEIENL